MILGNILRGNVVALERFFHALTHREEEYIYYISLGATLQEAVTPLLRESIKAAVSPFIGTMATLGLVSLPGMMTGQILGGNSPLVAIQYQIMIMIAIFVTYTLSIFLAVRFTLNAAVDPYGRIRKKIFTNPI